MTSSESWHRVEASLARLEAKTDHILEQVRKINGRVAGLENWRHEQQIRQAAEDARRDTAITKRQLYQVAAFIIGSVGAITAVMKTIL